MAHHNGLGAEAFDHAAAAAVVSTHDIFIAGGIDSANVGELIQTLNPYGIDVSSGVEALPGEKDFEKLDALFNAVRGAQPG